MRRYRTKPAKTSNPKKPKSNPNEKPKTKSNPNEKPNQNPILNQTSVKSKSKRKTKSNPIQKSQASESMKP